MEYNIAIESRCHNVNKNVRRIVLCGDLLLYGKAMICSIIKAQSKSSLRLIIKGEAQRMLSAPVLHLQYQTDRL